MQNQEDAPKETEEENTKSKPDALNIFFSHLSKMSCQEFFMSYGAAQKERN